MLSLSPADHPHLFALANFLGPSNARAWLVGGTVRDLLLGKRPADYDIAFSGDLTSEVRSWCRSEQGHWFWLDQTRNQSRVLLDGDQLQFDFAPLRADTLAEDLRLRDFTINAIALSLQDLTSGNLIDPTGGQGDLEHGILRICSADVLKDDPLRGLKGIRHHAQLGWMFEPETLRHMDDAARGLDRVAGERLRTELAQILASSRLDTSVALCVKTGLMPELLSSFDNKAFQHSYAEACQRLDALDSHEGMRKHLADKIEALIPLRSILLLALLLEHSTQSSAEFAERLRLSRRSRRILKELDRPDPVKCHFGTRDAPRVSALKVEQIGREPIATLLYALLRNRSGLKESSCAVALSHYVAQLKQGRVPDLVNGDEMKRRYPDLSGREIGTWQRKMKTAEIIGEISDKNGALRWLEHQFSN